MKKNQERRLHRKNAKLVKEGGTPMQINRVVKADTTVSNQPLSRVVGVAYRVLIELCSRLASLWTLRSGWSHEYVWHTSDQSPLVLTRVVMKRDQPQMS